MRVGITSEERSDHRTTMARTITVGAKRRQLRKGALLLVSSYGLLISACRASANDGFISLRIRNGVVAVADRAMGDEISARRGIEAVLGRPTQAWRKAGCGSGTSIVASRYPRGHGLSGLEVNLFVVGDKVRAVRLVALTDQANGGRTMPRAVADLVRVYDQDFTDAFGFAASRRNAPSDNEEVNSTYSVIVGAMWREDGAWHEYTATSSELRVVASTEVPPTSVHTCRLALAPEMPDGADFGSFYLRMPTQ